MTDRQSVDLGTVQETLLIPLWARAVEAKRPEPILQDSKATEMVDAIDYDFEKFAKGKASQVGCCVRASTIDRWVSEFLREHPRGTVVEIGAGLDTRFERLDNGEAQWFELDLPDVIETRRRFFEETSRRRFVAKSVLESAWISDIEEGSQPPVMFVAEGVLMYFEEEQVKELFGTLVSHFPGSAFAFDAMSPLMVRMQKRHDTIKETSAKFRWGIEAIGEIERWDPRYSLEESVRFHDLAKRHIARFPLMMRLMWFVWPAMRRSYGIHLARLGSAPEETP
jgi:methyltransferase (TIGR00027 family)